MNPFFQLPVSGEVDPTIALMKKMLLTGIILISYFSVYSQTGLYTLNGGTAMETGQTYAATLTDQSSVLVLNGGNLTLNNCVMTKTGDASDVNASSQYGINAGVLANTAGVVVISGGSVTTDASGGNGLFATGSGSTITMSNGTIHASGGGAHGVDVTYGGSITLTNVDVTTTGSNGSVLATDFGGGTVTVTGGTIVSTATEAGSHSAGIYSTGTITVSDANVTSMGDCGGVIDGANTIILSNTTLTGALHGFKTWKTAPASGSATISLSGGSLISQNGDGFYVTGETGNAASATITLSNGATVNASTGNIIQVLQSSNAFFTVDGSGISGNLIADATSTLNAILQNGTNLEGSAQYTGITLDETSSWVVTANSVMTTVINPSGISGLTVTNITGNGYNVYYDSTLSGNAYLAGQTYALVNGGVLTPGNPLGTNDFEETSVAPVLYQNSPNPVTGSTTISYWLPDGCFISLAVYHPTGKQVVVLEEGIREQGTHRVEFSTDGLPRGIYLYCLKAGNQMITRKLILLE